MRLYQRKKVSTHYIIEALILLFLVTLMSGCFHRSLPIAETTSATSWTKRKQMLERYHFFKLKGKASFQSPEESGTASFEPIFIEGDKRAHFKIYDLTPEPPENG